MASKTTVFLVDDLDGSDAAESVSFALDGVEYEIDLSEENAQDFRDSMGAYLERGRRVGHTIRSSGTGRRTPRRVPVDVDLGKVRAWAKSNGYEVKPRGRIAQAVIDAYRAAGY